MDVSQVGIYQFRIDLTDLNRDPKKRSYPFTIEVTKFSPAQLAMMERNRLKNTKKVTVTPVGMNEEGLLTLKLDQPIFSSTNNQSVLDVLNRTLISSLQIKKAYTQATYKLNWTVVKLENDTIVLKILFSNP
jgi:hypothetical protein